MKVVLGFGRAGETISEEVGNQHVPYPYELLIHSPPPPPTPTCANSCMPNICIGMYDRHRAKQLSKSYFKSSRYSHDSELHNFYFITIGFNDLN